MTTSAGVGARHWAARPGRLAVAVLVLVPVVTFAVPAIAGHPFLSGDNLIQNFPLRVLVARNLNSGHLPLWNPYIWSGTALLGGLNAGAFYPGTLLFTVLPAEAAWTINQILVYVVAALGLYLFLRRSRLSVGAAFLGSLSFSVGGFMSAQLGHIDLVQGASLVPWMLVALQWMAGSAAAPGAARPRVIGPTVLLGLCVSLLVLTGSPEALIDNSILVAIYGVWLARRSRRGRIVVQMVVAGAAAILVSAIQWLPGLAFASSSQRSGSSYAFFVSGSFPPKLTALTAMPYLLGGYGRFGVPIYHGQYNLAEVSTYIGIIPVCAAFAMLTRPWRARRAAQGLGVWYALIAVGLVLSFGGYTPLGHLLVHVPIYGQQRLQNRNMLTVDLALAVLFAHWIDGVRQRAGPGPGPAHPSRAERAITLLPGACLVALAAALVASPVVLSQELGSPVPLGSFHRLEAYLGLALVVALAGSLVAAGWDRIPRRRLLQVVIAVVAIDLVIYQGNQFWLSAPPRGALTDSTGLASAVADVTGPTGRFAIYDPDRSDPFALNHLGEPDLNVLRRLGSVQGYGSVVNGNYDRATGAHQQSDLSTTALAGSTFDDLNLTTLVTRPGYFTLPPGSTAAPTGPVPQTVPGHGQHAWYLGSPRRLTGVTVQLGLDPSCPLSPGGLAVGLLTPAGTTEAAGSLVPDPNRAGTASVALTGAPDAVGIVVTNGGTCALTVDSATVATLRSGRLLLAGVLQGAITPPTWRFVETLGNGFVVFHNTAAGGRFSVTSAPGTPAPGATLRVTDDPLTGNQSVVVATPAPAVVVRSVAAAPGWSATIRSGAHGPPRTVQVPTRGALVQTVPVPAGTSTVTWSYRPASATVGVAVTLAGLGVLGLLGLGWSVSALVRRARSRTRPGLAEGADRTAR